VKPLDSFPACLWNPKVHHRIHKNLSLSSARPSPHHSHPISPRSIARPIQTPYIPDSTSHIHMLSLRFFTQRIRPSLPCLFRNKFLLYGEGLLELRTTPKLEDHPLSFVRGCLFAATLHPQPENAPCRGDRDPT
jgi:hypothetical protein